MATPTILFDADNGNDGNSASGAGPATAVTGTQARNRASGSTTVGFYGTAPDLSLVAVDQTHALKLGTGAGRQWSAITAKKETVQTPAGSMNGSTAVVTSTDTTGIAQGDAFMVPGAGAAAVDLYSTVATIDSSVQLTLNNASGTAVGGVTCQCPKQVRVADTMTLTADTAWAIGGERADLTVTQLWDDLKAGWVVQLANTLKFTHTATITIDNGGDTTTGPIVIRGVGYPEIETASVRAFYVRTKYVRFEGIKFDTANSAIEIDSSSAGDVVIDDCEQVGAAELLEVTSAATTISRVTVRGSKCNGGSSSGITVAGKVKGLVVENCLFLDAVLSITAACFAEIRHCMFYGVAGGNAAVSLSSWSDNDGRLTFDHCGVDRYGKGITTTSLNSLYGLTVRNCSFTNCSGFALELVAGADNVKAHVDHNNFYLNATDRVQITAGANDVALDPKYRDLAAGDYRVALPLRALGWPQNVPTGTRQNWIDIGYSQRREPVGGSVLVRPISANDLGSEWELAFLVVTGASAGAYQAARVLKSAIPLETTPLEDAIEQAGLAFLRDGAAADLIGQEILA